MAAEYLIGLFEMDFFDWIIFFINYLIGSFSPNFNWLSTEFNLIGALEMFF
jgi:hypothetical protein